MVFWDELIQSQDLPFALILFSSSKSSLQNIDFFPISSLIIIERNENLQKLYPLIDSRLTRTFWKQLFPLSSLFRHLEAWDCLVLETASILQIHNSLFFKRLSILILFSSARPWSIQIMSIGTVAYKWVAYKWAYANIFILYLNILIYITLPILMFPCPVWIVINVSFLCLHCHCTRLRKLRLGLVAVFRVLPLHQTKFLSAVRSLVTGLVFTSFT